MDFHLSEASVVAIMLFVASYLIIGAGVIVRLFVTQNNLKNDVAGLKEDRVNVKEAVADLCRELHELREAFVQVVTELRIRAEQQ